MGRYGTARALSIAVCIAFLPSLIDGIWGPKPVDAALFMVGGVVLAWASNALRSTWSMIWRAMGAPEWLANTDFTSYMLFLLGYGLIRFALEFVRVPDANRGYLLWGWVTEGQILSVPMVIGGIVLLAVAYRTTPAHPA